MASCATNDWNEEELFQLVGKSYHYKNLSKEQFNTLIDMLSEGIEAKGRYGAYLFRDRINGIIKARRGARLTAITNGGAIPENALYTVIAQPEGTMIGTLDEDFAIESNRGDIILLGSTSWNIRRIESGTGRVFVEDAHGSPPTVPFWIGEAPARTDELSLTISNLRQLLSEQLILDYSPDEPIKINPLTFDTQNWLKEHCGVNQEGAEQIIEYILQGRALLGVVPTQKTIIAERFFDESGGMQLIIHSPYGARINKAWGLALRKCFCRSFNFELQASATDNGINISLTEQHSFPLMDVFNFLHINTIKEVLVQAVLQSPLFTTRWRWDAGRSLALTRFRNGKKVPPFIFRMRSEDLLAAVFPDAAACQDNLNGEDVQLPDHPLINETMKDCLDEALDLDGLIKVLTEIKNNTIQCVAIDTPTPSVFTHEILNANPYAFLDDAPLEERRARAVEMRRILPQKLLENIGALDPEAIQTVKSQTWPDIRSMDELHDTLQTLIAYPAWDEDFAESNLLWASYFDELVVSGRAGTASVDNKIVWFAVEKAKTLSLIYPQAEFNQQPIDIEEQPLDKDESIANLVRHWMHVVGPITSKKLSHILSLNQSEVEQVLLRLEATGLILRGTFSNSTELEWCERRLLARIHQLTLGRLRKEIEPVSASQFVRWLLDWQHLSPGTQLSGEQGLLHILEQLQGFEAPAKSWESGILAKRLTNFDPQWLDRLCLMGVVGWGRFSMVNTGSDNTVPVDYKRIIPTSVAPITFFIRDTSQWIEHNLDAAVENNLGYIAKSVHAYLTLYGASFFSDIVDGVGFLKTQVEMALWELVTAGFATADAFDNLRSLIDPHRRLVKKRRRPTQHMYSTGRWSLLKTFKPKDFNEHIEANCWLLLKRYGVVFRDLLAREKNTPRWRDLLIGFRRLEQRGEIRGGRFVDGFLGEQFALPIAVSSLRAIKRKEPNQNVISISAVDPLNVVGYILPGNRITAISNRVVKLQDGIAINEPNFNYLNSNK